MVEERLTPRRIHDRAAGHIAAYHRGLTAASVAAAGLLWLAALALNGYFTVVVLGNLLGWSVAACVAIQVVASLIEIGLWRSDIRILYPLIFLIGVLDVGTSAIGVEQWIGDYDASWAVISTAIGMFIALAPEPLLTVIAAWSLEHWYSRK